MMEMQAISLGAPQVLAVITESAAVSWQLAEKECHVGVKGQ